MKQRNKEKICVKCKKVKDRDEYVRSQLDSVYGQCRECKRDYDSERYRKKGEIIRKHRRERYAKPEIRRKEKEQGRERYKNPKVRERMKKYDRIYSKKPEVIKRKKKYYEERYGNDPVFRFRANVASVIRQSLKGNKNGWHWEILVGYRLEDLKKNLENQFKEDMTWDNYGEWHLDHKIPLKYKVSDGEYFWDQEELMNPRSKVFKEAWGLSNLQPMWGKENKSKNNRYIGNFKLCWKRRLV